MDTRICTRCNGQGFRTESWDAVGTSKPCYACDGQGHFPAVEVAPIRALVINPKTGKTFSTSLNSKDGRKRADSLGALAPVTPYGMLLRRRAQYVWRIARWHAGVDGTGFNLGGAIMADMDLMGDPWKPELDTLADLIADECYGRGANLRAARRWTQALHGR